MTLIIPKTSLNPTFKAVSILSTWEALRIIIITIYLNKIIITKEYPKKHRGSNSDG